VWISPHALQIGMPLAYSSAKMTLGGCDFLGAGVFHLGNTCAEPWREARNGPSSCATRLSIDIVPSHAARVSEMPRFLFAGSRGILEADLPSGQTGFVLRCRIHGSAHDLSDLQRHLNRTINERRSGRVMAGMVLLLALCAWISGGDEAVRRAVLESAPGDDTVVVISPEVMRRRFGARQLYRHEMPVLFGLLDDICRRANLARSPEIYYIAASVSMNAYALGGPDRSAITLTEGLLRGMTRSEISGILAHEVAHICNNDGWAMGWAAALHRMIALISLSGLTSSQGNRVLGRPLVAFLRGASTISHLLCLALSRARELDADAFALELVDDPRALVAALAKLERHHTNSPFAFTAAPSSSLMGYLRSHPATAERVSMIMSLAR
jgi:heat shock protein HtpX